MTREEAIGFGEMWLDMNEDAKDSQTYAFFERAIGALKREQQFLDAGYKNGRVEFMIGGRKFMVKEMAQ